MVAATAHQLKVTLRPELCLLNIMMQLCVLKKGSQRVTGDNASEFSLWKIIINLSLCTNITYYSKHIRQWWENNQADALKYCIQVLF